MKGTFISTDFVKHSDGTYRFLELNTDTSMPNEYISNQNSWDGFITFLSQSAFTKLDVIYKPEIQENIVVDLSSSIQTNATFVTEFTKYEEDIDTIYPATPEDASDKFILRMAYDENAILDSVYGKNNLNPLLLFSENTASNNTVPCYFSSSEDFIDTFERKTNDSNLPDVVLKTVSTADNVSVEFLKLKAYESGGLFYTSSEFDTTRVNDFINNKFPSLSVDYDTDVYVQNYNIHQDSITDDVVQSLRNYHIVYGGSLSCIHLGTINLQAEFSIPSASQLDWDGETYTSLKPKHYLEFSTSTRKEKMREGLFETEKYVSQSGEILTYDEIESGSHVKSYHIVGLPDTDDSYQYLKWKHTGNTLPSGSAPSSSYVVEKYAYHHDGILCELKLVGDTEAKYISPKASLLHYNQPSNTTQFAHIRTILPTENYIYDETGSLVQIEENNLLVLNDATGSVNVVDIETSDVLLTEGSTLTGIGLFVHNCFIAGTEIVLANGDLKNIEDVVEGDNILQYNHETDDYEIGTVGSISSHDVNKIIRLTINNEDVIECTPQHPFYVKDKGYQQAKNLNFGDEVLKSNGSYTFISTIEELNTKTTVYNLHDVKKNENFFAGGVLVHNKPGGQI